MKSIFPTAILDYYDGVLIFAGRDQIGGHYVGSIIDTVDGIDQYLVTGANPERLRQFRVGLVDLRSLLLEAPGGEWFLTSGKGEPGDPLILQPQYEPLDTTDFLPEPNFFLEDGPIDDLALQRARERGNVVFEFSVDPPEASDEHRIRAETLAQVLIYIQSVVRWAYRNAIKDLSSQIRRRIGTIDGHLMDVVVPAAAGSYRVILEGSKSPDLFGWGELVRALQKLDAVFATANNLQTVRISLQEHRGHLARSYINLIKFLADKNTGLNYSWADGMSVSSHRGGVSGATAKSLANIFSETDNLAVENTTLVGEFERVNRSTGSWGLMTVEGVKVGKVVKGGPSLNGLEVGRRYRFDCHEEFKVDAAGREIFTYYLRNVYQD